MRFLLNYFRTLHPAPYTLHLTPYTLRLTPYTLQENDELNAEAVSLDAPGPGAIDGQRDAASRFHPLLSPTLRPRSTNTPASPSLTINGSKHADAALPLANGDAPLLIRGVPRSCETPTPLGSP